MNPLPIIAALLKAGTAALNALPIALAWKINSDIESNNEKIIELSDIGTVESLRIADQLRLKNAYRQRLHDTLFPSNASHPSGNSDSNIVREIPVSEE